MDAANSNVSLDDVLPAVNNVQLRKPLDSLLAGSLPNETVNPGITVDTDVAMHHSHLPKGADCGVINWNGETDSVTNGPNIEAPEEVLECLANGDGLLPPVEGEV